MSDNARVLWTEGLFLCPQTFQQHDNFIFNQIESRTASIESYFWGVISLDYAVDQENFYLKKCQGIFKDGTPFDIGENTLDTNIDHIERDKFIYLAIGKKSDGTQEVVNDGSEKKTTRYFIKPIKVKDTHTINHNKEEELQTGALNFQLIVSHESPKGFSSIRLAQIKSCEGNRLELSESFIPPTPHTHTSKAIKKYIENVNKQLSLRVKLLADNLGDPSSSNIVELSMLQIMNRNLPLFEFLQREPYTHPKQLYLYAIQLAGELSTYTREERRPRSYPPESSHETESVKYKHDDLELTFRALFNDIHNYIHYSSTPKSHSISLDKNSDYGGYGSGYIEPSIFADCDQFVLAVTSSLPEKKLKHCIDFEARLASNLDHVRNLTARQEPGVPLKNCSRPQTIPPCQNTLYFELDTYSIHWGKIKINKIINIHIATNGGIPNVIFKLWAIRSIDT